MSYQERNEFDASEFNIPLILKNSSANTVTSAVRSSLVSKLQFVNPHQVQDAGTSVTLPLKIWDLVGQLNVRRPRSVRTSLIRSLAVYELFPSINTVSELFQDKDAKYLSHFSSGLMKLLIVQGSLDCAGDLRHILLQDREGVPPYSKRGIGMNEEFFYHAELEIKYKMTMLRLWFNTRSFFNQLLRACFKIMTCFNKSVILLEQGADWYLRPKNWWELIINSSERTSLSNISPQHSHQQMATSRHLSDNGLMHRCLDYVQPNSNMEVAIHASNHRTQPNQQTQQPPCENSMSNFQGTQLGGQLNVLDQESTTTTLWTMSPSLHNSTSNYFSDLTCLPQIPQQLWTLPQQRWQQQLWAHHSIFSLLLLCYKQQKRKGDQATSVYLNSRNTTWRNHMI